MPSVQMLNGSWKSGAATSSTGSDGFEIPNLCSPLAVFGVVLASQLLALLLTLAGQPGWWAFYSHLAQTALLLLWIGLLSAALLCRLRGWLTRFTVPEGSVITFLVVMGSVAAVSEAAFWLGRILGAGPDTGGGWFPTNHLAFLTRNLAIGMLVTAPVLRYFYVSQQWQRNVRREAESRLNALQARIRPHFLFNSMNTIAALTRTNPLAAEQAVEDLADLFRASLRDGRQLIPLREELEIARVYERMEQHRLGDRLQVDWQLGPAAGRHGDSGTHHPAAARKRHLPRHRTDAATRPHPGIGRIGRRHGAHQRQQPAAARRGRTPARQPHRAGQHP